MIYLDHAATTPLDPLVLEAMLPHMREHWGNASSPHAKGREARAAIDTARANIAALAGVQPHEIIFVSSGSEGNSLALFGLAETWLQLNKKPGHLILSSIEHSCSLKAADKLRLQGWSITTLPVDEFGMVRPEDLETALQDDTMLVSIHAANNEVGTLQPVADIAAICRERGVPFHCDAVQGVGLIPLPQADIITIAAHKFYGPKGIAMLIMRDHLHPAAQILGGGQEFGLRAGTEYTAGIVGLSKALELSLNNLPTAAAAIRQLRDDFVAEVLQLEGTSLNGHPELRLPGFANIRFAGHSAENMVINLDMQGICVSSGAACAGGAVESSHVLKAMGQSQSAARENVRFSLGKDTTQAELETVVECIKKCIIKNE